MVYLKRDYKSAISLDSTWNLDVKPEGKAVSCRRVNQDELEFPSMNKKVF